MRAEVGGGVRSVRGGKGRGERGMRVVPCAFSHTDLLVLVLPLLVFGRELLAFFCALVPIEGLLVCERGGGGDRVR